MNIFEKSKSQESDYKLFFWLIVFFVFPIVCVFFVNYIPFEFIFNSTKTNAIVVEADSLKSTTKPFYYYTPIVEFSVKNRSKIRTSLKQFSYPKDFKLGEFRSIYYLNSYPEQIYEFNSFTIGILGFVFLITFMVVIVIIAFFFPNSTVSKIVTKHLT